MISFDLVERVVIHHETVCLLKPVSDVLSEYLAIDRDA
jgi:hypothetical protein